MRSWLAVSGKLLLLLLALFAMLPQFALALTPSQVYEQVKDSIVVVKAYDQKGRQVGLGSGVMLDLHVGHYFIKSVRLGGDYTDFGIRVSKLFNDLEASLSVTDTNQDPSSNLNDATLVLSGKYRF